MHAPTSWRSMCRVLAIGAAVLVAAAPSRAQGPCPLPELAGGLLRPLSLVQTPLGNLLVSESGEVTPNTGRLSIVGSNGSRRTLLDGLPSGLNDVGEPSGPAGVFIRGRTLYLAIGVGDTQLPGGAPNPDPSSPIFSSVLAVHFSANVERTTNGFMLSVADHQALADGEPLTMTNGGGDTIVIDMLVDFPDTQPVNKNPFGLVAVGPRLYVTDGGQNLVWQVDLPTRTFSVLATFPQVSNPLFGIIGPELTDAVPTGITYAGGQLLVTLFTGVPFAPGTSSVVQVDPATGARTPLIAGLKTAIGVVATQAAGDLDHLVLQHASAGPFFGSPGSLLRFDTPDGIPVAITTCLTRPSSMVFDAGKGTVYVAEVVSGAILTVQGGQ